MKMAPLELSKGILVTMSVAVIGGFLFQLLHIPVPWLIGPMVTMIFANNLLKHNFVWHGSLRTAGLMIVGYTIGISLTKEALIDIAKQLPIMFSMTFSLVVLCVLIAWIVVKISGIDFETAILSSIPGGLSQILTLAEETKGINFSVVAVTQIIRVILIIISMPLLVLLPMFQSDGENKSAIVIPEINEIGFFPNIIYFVLASIIFTYIGRKIKLPTPQLLGPILATMTLQLFNVPGPELSGFMINLGQFMIGIYVGLLLNTKTLPSRNKTIGLALISGVMLIFGAVLLSYLLVWLKDFSNATALLSLAPGGTDQMGIIAHEVNADLSTVSGYQLFRTLFIFFFVPVAFNLIFKPGKAKQVKKQG